MLTCTKDNVKLSNICKQFTHLKNKINKNRTGKYQRTRVHQNARANTCKHRHPQTHTTPPIKKKKQVKNTALKLYLHTVHSKILQPTYTL